MIDPGPVSRPSCRSPPRLERRSKGLCMPGRIVCRQLNLCSQQPGQRRVELTEHGWIGPEWRANRPGMVADVTTQPFSGKPQRLMPILLEEFRAPVITANVLG